MKLDIHKAFQIGAKRLAGAQREYTDLHKQHGIEEHHWNLLTQNEYWSGEQARQIRSILASALEVSMTIANMPAIPLPGHYTAALISSVVHPINQMLACCKAPDTFDAEAASGILRTHEVKNMSREQLMSLVIAYSGGFAGEPPAERLDKEVSAAIARDNERKEKK